MNINIEILVRKIYMYSLYLIFKFILMVIEKINNWFLKEFILEVVEIVLINNIFIFNGKYFK